MCNDTSFVQYGLYSSFMGPFLYVLFGTVKELTIGPTAIIALMTYTYAKSGGPEYAILLAFLTGCVELLAGLFNLGNRHSNFQWIYEEFQHFLSMKQDF
jgi:MFS superfamily sulfate permease-like transporter